MRGSVLLVGFILLICCDDQDQSMQSPTVLLAAAQCGRTAAEMSWMEELLERSKKDVALSGNIYALTMDGQTIFVHQPAVMSCMACLLYNCDGTRVDHATMDMQAVVEKMTPANLIYSPY